MSAFSTVKLVFMDRNILDFRNFGSISLGKSIRMERVKLLSPSHASQTVAGQLGLKSSQTLSQLGPGSTRPESTRPGVFSEQICDMLCFLYVHNHSD